MVRFFSTYSLNFGMPVDAFLFEILVFYSDFLSFLYLLILIFIEMVSEQKQFGFYSLYILMNEQ